MRATETIFQALYELLRQTQTLDPSLPAGDAFVTTSRRAPQVSSVGPALQPALYILQGDQTVEEKRLGLAAYEMSAAAIVLVRLTGGTDAIASTALNYLRDAVIGQLLNFTLAADGATVIPHLAGTLQTLGGVVYHARIKGKVHLVEGLINNQSALIFPISILSPM